MNKTQKRGYNRLYYEARKERLRVAALERYHAYGKDSLDKDARAAYMKKYRKLYPDKFRKTPLQERVRSLKRFYGLTVEDVEAMLEAQYCKCAICGDGPTEDPRHFPLVDHCHKTKKSGVYSAGNVITASVCSKTTPHCSAQLQTICVHRKTDVC